MGRWTDPLSGARCDWPVALLIYIGSVMRFILFDSVIARECHIRAGWAAAVPPASNFLFGNFC
jgi:hypothetical protein